MPKIRPKVRGFGPVAPTGGAAVGAGLQAAGQALGAFAELGTNRELLDIQEQEQIDRLEFAQFEKVERSEAIVQFTQKQIARNEASERILAEARENRNYEHVQSDMDEWENGRDQEVFEGRSELFREIFESMDRSPRVGQINQLGTAIQAGNLGIIRDNYQISIDNFVEGVNAASDPAAIVENFDMMRELGVNLGMTGTAIEATAGEGLRAAMTQYVRSLPLVDGLAALSDEDVAEAFTEGERELLKRDLNTKVRRLKSAQKFVNEVTLRTLSIDVLDAFSRGESATSLSERIRNSDVGTPTQKKDALDFVEVLAIARERGPQSVDPEVVRTNQELSKGLMGRAVDRAGSIRKEGGEREELLGLVADATEIYRDAVLKNEQGAFGSPELVKLRFQMEAITEGLVVAEEVAKKGIFSSIAKAAAFILSPSLAATLGGESEVGLRTPSGIMSDEIRSMFLGEGRYGGLSSEDKASMEAFLIAESIKEEDSNKPIPVEEANAKVQEAFASAQKRFMTEGKRLSGEVAEQVESVIFNAGAPAAEPRRQPSQSILADLIRTGLDAGMTEERIRELASAEAGFSDEAFDGALAAVTVGIQ